MMGRFTRAAAALAVLSLIVFTAGCPDKASNPPGNKAGEQGGKKDGKKDEKKDDKTTKARTPLGKAAFTLTSADFVAEFKKDSKAAHAKYKDKVVELTGPIRSIGFNADDDPLFQLQGPDPKMFAGAACVFAEPRPWKKAAPGQTVTVKGKGHPWAEMANLVGCEILDVKGAPPPHLTADELGKEYAAGVEEAGKKYNEKYLVLSGEIDKISDKEGILFKTQSPMPEVFARFSPTDFKLVASWKPGQKVEVIGTYLLNLGKESVQLITCLPMEDPK